ncbi:DUF6290 family protein [Methylocaldum szegediense]|uniref:Uncharacterized protein n=1 Tax=Methylocaldum szegediense TaxID=73780 RepID=A0ABM9I1L8_9GAMM|nr:DUF6290 family protein [Methylocaldum szegediense]CAI8830480.1 conserved protein of unknown function [Methylocaldum szegediense]
MSTTVSIHVTKQQWKLFKAAAEKQGITLSDLMRSATQQAIDAEQQEDRLAVLETKLATGFKALSEQIGLVKKTLDGLVAE